MTTIRVKLPSITDVEFTVSVEPEYEDIAKCISTGDEEQDRRDVALIETQLENGNEWAWCSACVTASYRGLSAQSWLGCCSYKDEEDFKKCGYWEYLKKEVYADLIKKINSLKD